MSGILEITIAVTGMMAVFTGCCVKISAQMENSRCTSISCCQGIINCDRDLSSDVKEVQTDITAPNARTASNAPIRPTLQQLRSRYE